MGPCCGPPREEDDHRVEVNRGVVEAKKGKWDFAAEGKDTTRYESSGRSSGPFSHEKEDGECIGPDHDQRGRVVGENGIRRPGIDRPAEGQEAEKMFRERQAIRRRMEEVRLKDLPRLREGRVRGPGQDPRQQVAIQLGPDRTGAVVGRAGKAICLLYTSPSPRDKRQSRMPSSA